MSGNRHVQEPSCQGTVMSGSCHVDELSCQGTTMSVSCHVRELSCQGFVMSGSCHVMVCIFNYIFTQVTNATSDPNQPLFNVQTSDGKSTEYDLVIIAHPLVKGQSNIEFSGYSTDFTEHRREFHRTIAYIVEGEPNYKYFGYSSLSAMPDDVFPLDKDSFFNSLSEIFPVTQPPVPNQRVYKVFANAGLAEEQLDLLFLSRKSTQAVDWLAYPQYQPNMQLVPFVLAPRLYYVNAIELAASAMEMSAVGGVNVANLATHQLFSNLHLIDNMFIIEEKHIKIEL